MIRRWPWILVLVIAAGGCGGTIREQRSGTADFDRGKASYDRREWFEAIADLKAYVERYPGTDRTDDALFYLGMAYFHSKDYALASSQFDRLARDFPQSPFQPDALFYLARCDDLDSSPAPLDQTETIRAIDRYRHFLELYPEHARAAEARARQTALRDRLAEKRYRNARLYDKLDQEEAAILYARKLIEEHPTSRWAGDAALLLAELLVEQGKRAEAAEALRRVPDAATPEVKERARRELESLGVSGSR